MAPASRSLCCGLVRRDALPQTREELRIYACLACLSVMDGVTRVLGPLLIVLAYTLIGLFTYTYFDVIAPAHDWPTAVYVPVTGLGVFLLWNVLFNLSSAVLTPPGDVRTLGGGASAGGRQASRAATAAALAPSGGAHGDGGGGGGDDEEDGSDDDVDDDLRGAKHGHAEDGVTWTYCRSCRKWRPPRAHHCQVCGVCVLKMDHHCVWINRCAGHGNYVFFWRILAYVVAGCAFMGAVALGPWLRSLDDPGYPAGSEAWRWPGAWALASPRTRLGLSFALPVALTVAVGGLLAWHIKLLGTNQTSIEWHQNLATRSRLRVAGRLWRNAYDLGSWSANLEAVFGTRSLLRALLLPYPHLTGTGGGGAAAAGSPLLSRDGTWFPTVDSVASGAGGGGGGAAAPRRLPRFVGSMSASTAAAAAAAAASAGAASTAATAAAAASSGGGGGGGTSRRSVSGGGGGRRDATPPQPGAGFVVTDDAAALPSEYDGDGDSERSRLTGGGGGGV
jgi:hypothetical protein